MVTDDRPDSGIFEIEQLIEADDSSVGRREDDRIWAIFMRKAWGPHRSEFRDMRERMRTMEAAVRTMSANQEEILTALWGTETQRRKHEAAGLMATKQNIDRVMVYLLCPTWRLMVRVTVAALALWGGHDAFMAATKAMGMEF